jgi:hypothetical protein
VWWDVSIYQIGADCGMISLRRRSEKDLRAVNRRHTKLMRMLLLLQRARRKEVLRRDLSKVRCYCCNQLGHLASRCPERKKKTKPEGPETTATTTMEDFASKYERNFLW